MAKWRVLVIDDDTDCLELIRMTLESKYDVLTTDTSTDTLELVNVFEPDLIILDIIMPKVTGYQIIEILRQRKETAKLPVIFLSAKNTTRDVKYGYKLGATTYITKPFQPERLLRNVDNIFDLTPPERRPKKWSMDEVRERLNLMKQYGFRSEMPKPHVPRPEPIRRKEIIPPEDKVWQD